MGKEPDRDSRSRWRVRRLTVKHYPGLRNEVKNLKGEIYDLRAKLKKIGKNQEAIETACQEIYTTVHEDQEDTPSWGCEEEDSI